MLRLVPLFLLLACSLSTSPKPPDGATRVLFIGNSFTYTNQLPRTIADLARKQGLNGCDCVQIALPDYALEDHATLGEATTLLNDEEWDFVVMQQGPSALPDSRSHLVQWATYFGSIVDSRGAIPIMYGVWPSAARSFDFPNVRDSYRAAADAIGARFAPAGEAWQAAWRRDATLPLYAGDNFHPSPMGTYLAALVIYQRIYGRSPVGVETTAHVAGKAQTWSASVVQLLQEAAAEANAAEDVAMMRRR
jgi:hypothetical protein